LDHLPAHTYTSPRPRHPGILEKTDEAPKEKGFMKDICKLFILSRNWWWKLLSGNQLQIK